MRKRVTATRTVERWYSPDCASASARSSRVAIATRHATMVPAARWSICLSFTAGLQEAVEQRDRMRDAVGHAVHRVHDERDEGDAEEGDGGGDHHDDPGEDVSREHRGDGLEPLGDRDPRHE